MWTVAAGVAVAWLPRLAVVVDMPLVVAVAGREVVAVVVATVAFVVGVALVIVFVVAAVLAVVLAGVGAGVRLVVGFVAGGRLVRLRVVVGVEPVVFEVILVAHAIQIVVYIEVVVIVVLG